MTTSEAIDIVRNILLDAAEEFGADLCVATDQIVTVLTECAESNYDAGYDEGYDEGWGYG